MHSNEEHWSRRQNVTSPAEATARRAAHPFALLRRLRYLARYLGAFAQVIVAHPHLLWRNPGRTLILGKLRRTLIVCVPGLAMQLKRRHALTGGCVSCGASCNLLLKCPHWDGASRLCSIYADRPLVCRLFPITPSDLEDRDLAAGGSKCGYSFVTKPVPATTPANAGGE